MTDRKINEEEAWADTLDWKHNDYDFYLMTRSILGRLDSDFRTRWGLRIDQLAEHEQIHDRFQTCRTLYQQEEEFQRVSIYAFLHLTANLWLGGKACDVLDQRREAAERLMDSGGTTTVWLVDPSDPALAGHENFPTAS